MGLQGRSGRAGRVEAGHYHAFSLFFSPSLSLLLYDRLGVKRCHILSLAARWEADTISYPSSVFPAHVYPQLFILCTFFFPTH